VKKARNNIYIFNHNGTPSLRFTCMFVRNVIFCAGRSKLRYWS